MKKEHIPCGCAVDLVLLMSARDHAEAAIISEATGENFWMKINEKTPEEFKKQLKERFIPKNALNELRKAAKTATEGPCDLSDIATATPLRGTHLSTILDMIDEETEKKDYRGALLHLDMVSDIIVDNAAFICR